MSVGIVGLMLNCFIEVLNAFFGARDCPNLREPLEVRIVGLRVHHYWGSRGWSLVQVDTDLLGDGVSYLILHYQHILQIALVALCPQVLVAGRLNQVGSDANSITPAQHCAFDHRIDIQFTRNLRQRLACTAVLNYGHAGDDSQRTYLSKSGDQLVGHSFGEVILRWIAGKIAEGYNCERSDLMIWRINDSSAQHENTQYCQKE